MADLWDSPNTSISTPDFDATEGHAVFTGYTAVPIYEDDGFSTQREGKIWRGVQYYDGATPLEATHANIDALTGQLYDKFRIVMYHAFHRLDRLVGLLLGPRQSNYVAENMGAVNFSETFTFTATGSGTTVTIYHNAAQRPWALKGSRSTPTSLVPGIFVFDGALWARITDVVHGASTCQLTLDRALNCTASGSLTVVIENAARGYPVLPLELPAADRDASPLKCLHDVKANHQAYSSFAAVNPSAPTAAGIDGARFCTKLDQEGVDLSQFKAGDYCANTSCPFYSPHKAGVDLPEHFSRFFLSKGDWTRQITPGISQNWNFRVGRDGWPGLLQLIGLRVGCFAEEYSLQIGWKTFVAQDGLLYFSDGTRDAQGLEVFKRFSDVQRERRDAGQDESDDVGILAAMANAETYKRDPAAPGVLQDRGGWTPGYTFERAIGIRRSQGAGFSESSINPSGDGERGVQRLVPARHTSHTFRSAAVANNTSWTTEETVVTKLASAQTVDGFTWDVEFQIPQYGRKVSAGTTPRFKMNASIDQMTRAGTTLNIYFTLGTETLYYNNPAYPSDPLAPPTIDSTFKCGGNVVYSDASHVIDHPASSRVIGDPQAGLYPGDRLTFTSGPLSGLSVVCIGAQAFYGPPAVGQPEPHPSVAGIPHYVRSRIHRCDLGRFRLEGATYAKVRDFMNSMTPASFPISCTIDMGAVAPLDRGVTLKRVNGDTVVTLDPSAYQFDHATGVFRVNTAGWDTSTDYRLHAELEYVNSTVYTHPVENALALLDKLEVVRSNGWVRASFTGDGVRAQSVLVYPEENTHNGLPITVYGHHAFGVPREETFSIFGASQYVPYFGEPADQYILVEDTGTAETGGVLGMESFIGNIGTDRDGTLWFIYQTYMNRLGLDPQLQRLSSSWVAQAKCHLVIRGAAYRRDYYFHEGESTEAEGGTTLLDSPDLAIQIFEATGDPTKYDLKEVGVFETGEATRTYNEDLDEWEYSATVDCTEVVKIILDNPRTTYLAAPRVLSPNNIDDVTGLAKSLVEWRSRPSGDDWIWDLSYYKLEFSSYDLGPIYIKLTPSALTEGVMHFDHAKQAIGANLVAHT